MEVEANTNAPVAAVPLLPRWSKKVLRTLVAKHREEGKRTILSRHVHDTLYGVLEGVLRRLVRGFAMERQTCPAKMTDVDVVEHVVRYDHELQFLLSDLTAVREKWNEWKKESNVKELAALPHYRMKSSLKRAIRDARKQLGNENPRVMLDLVSFTLFLLETWLDRVADGLAKLTAVTHRTTVSLADIRLVLDLMLPGQAWVGPILTQTFPEKPKKEKAQEPKPAAAE